ncbi:MAG: 50S ribosomal protein L22 [Gammaproteobacteria bacterium]
MKVSAKLRYARISPQKIRLIADQVRGKSVAEADQTLAFMPKKGAKILRKILNSAIANAEHNNGADIDELKISSVMVDEAPRFRRWEARAKGNGNRIIKRNSHITLQVADE